MQRLFASFKPASQNNQENDNDMPWLFVTGARALATFAGLIAILFGTLGTIVSVFDIKFFIAEIILVIEGLIMILIEAPCFCMFLDFAFLPSKFFEKKSLWFKAATYLCFSGIPLFLSISFNLVLSCFFIFISSGLYLVLALGKKASAQEMRAKIVNENPTSVLVNNEVLPATSGSTAQPSPFYKNTDIKNSTFTAPPPTLNSKNDSIVY